MGPPPPGTRRRPSRPTEAARSRLWCLRRRRSLPARIRASWLASRSRTRTAAA
jgi:hypothetical protein